jgi:hypothetical protein
LSVTSCHKDCKTEAPVILVATPAEAGNIQLPNSVNISGSISDDVWLDKVTVMVLDANDDTVFISQPDVYGKKNYNFTYNYYTTTAGTFHLHVVAEDNEAQETEKEIMFTVLP